MLKNHAVLLQADELRRLMNQTYRIDEPSLVSLLCAQAELTEQQLEAIQTIASELVTEVRREGAAQRVNTFLKEFALSSKEGLALMSLVEALLRIPDNQTIDALIKDKLTSADWKKASAQQISSLSRALGLSAKLLSPQSEQNLLTRTLFGLIHPGSKLFIRSAINQAVSRFGCQFVFGKTIEEALSRAQKKEAQGYRYSYDMLGERALTAHEAARYFESYKKAIEKIGEAADKNVPLSQRPGISVKLSALHPRYHELQRERVLKELPSKLLALARLAKHYELSFTIDAEESDCLDLSLDVIETVFSEEALAGWDGFGLAVQSYQKRAFSLLDWIDNLAKAKKRRIMVRLIKGAYWDSEIKKAQVEGLSDYPVFTQKAFTDVSFQACAKKMLSMTETIYPQFATHNAYSIAMILKLVDEDQDFEFQCLHGMGEAIYAQLVSKGIPCRIYAPVGPHEELLAYLARRLLENGANSSFLNHLDGNTPLSRLLEDPVAKSKALLASGKQQLPLPAALFLPNRRNSVGFDFSDRALYAKLQSTFTTLKHKQWQASPLIACEAQADRSYSVYSPQQTSHKLGTVAEASAADLENALTMSVFAFEHWSKTSVVERASLLRVYADLLHQNRAELLYLACLEAGKTLPDGMAEIREAIDFCNYYAELAEQLMANPRCFQGYTGEYNELSLHPRGTVLCISPWNFPLAIFTGQIVAALVTGNCVIAKPAEQTSLMAYFAVQLMHQAGIPRDVVQLVPGPGARIGETLVMDERISAVLFTGSMQTARQINRSLAARDGAIIPFIAETGGQNAMIVDSSARLDQMIVDVLRSAFGSAGQRCSALRVLFIQDDIYIKAAALLKGAMAELQIADPFYLSTDVGPVIDKEALADLKNHVETMKQSHEILYQSPLDARLAQGYFMPPTAIAIDSIDRLDKEVFGPILHVIRYKKAALEEIIHAINKTGYGLTLGIQSRVTQTQETIKQGIHVGNCYVNRNMVGAVVGLQPFGGEGLSGTGPKAGGPNYLIRLCHERMFTVDTTAAGGNAQLLTQ